MGRTAGGRLALLAAVIVVGFVVVKTATASSDGSKKDASSTTAALVPSDNSLTEPTGTDPTAGDLGAPEDTSDVPPEERVATIPTDAGAPVEAVPGTVLVVGGSSLAGLKWDAASQSALQGAEFTLDLESCRRLYVPSCSALRKSAPSTAVEVIQQKGQGMHTLVLFGGYNDSGRRFQEGFQKVVEAARAVGIKRIVWANYRTPADYVVPADPLGVHTYKSNNVIMTKLMQTGDYPDVVVMHWNEYSSDQDYWFSDDVHFSALGAWAAADYLSRKLAYLDDRACPKPRRAGEKVQNPCPDPDKKPPDVDFQSVYKFKKGRLACYDVPTKPKHIECRPPSQARNVFETLRFGMNDGQVTVLQARLKKLGLYQGTPSGEYDEDTVVAVMKFQQKHDLAITGTAGPRTRDELGFGCPDQKVAPGDKCPKDKAKVVFIGTVERGSTGVRVYVVQKRLRELGYLEAKPDSRFGKSTEDAVKAFQKKHKLEETGIVDEETAKKLGFVVPVTSSVTTTTS